MDTRTEDSVRCSKTNKKRHIQRMRSPLRYTRPYRPRFEGKNLRPRFFRTMEERFLRRPNFALRYQRHHTGQWSSLKLSRKTRASSPPNQQFDKGLNKNSPTAHTKPSSTDIPRLSSGDRSSLSFTVSQNSSNRDALSSVTCAGARSRAIQKKQEQIEEKTISPIRSIHCPHTFFLTPPYHSLKEAYNNHSVLFLPKHKSCFTTINRTILVFSILVCSLQHLFSLTVKSPFPRYLQNYSGKR
ncbi:uncharacterized protein LOC127169219 isoform X1 [Labeo rohita]|uniref:uncharacterized protein LOC127169219 isoform X1 n=1 Tax=Labeo rohita TaxID=84645 RepID=UPI0021E2FA0F|nr:uncharacterized protein LOC127169219 isoform X1 [Labeo rohita]